MKFKWKAFALGVMCAITLGAAFSAVSVAPKAATGAASKLTVSMDDFDENSFVFSSSTEAAGGMQYSFADQGALSLENQTGIAIRVKNLYQSTYQINQIRVMSADTQTVLSPRNSKTYFYWENGYVSEASVTGGSRLVNIPGNFDGYMLLPFDQMTVLRFTSPPEGKNANQWYFDQTEHLSAEGEGDFAFPAFQVKTLAMYTLANTAGREVMFGGHSTYVKNGENYELSAPIYADFFAATKPGSEPLPTIRAITKLTCNFTSDEHATLSASIVTVPYGYTAVAPVTFESGYEQGSVTVTDGEAVTQSSVAIKNTYTTDKTVSVAIASKQMGLDETSRLLDPDDGATANANFGGRLPFTDTLSARDAEGLFVRVRNPRDHVNTVNTIYLRGSNEECYSLMETEISYVALDGTVTVNKVGTGGRGTRVPALFDGYMLIPFDQLTAARITGMTTWDWSKRTGEWLRADAADPMLALPECEISGLDIYFAKGIKQNTSELIFGNAGMYVGEGKDFRTTQTTTFKQDTQSVTGNSGTITVSAFPTTSVTVTLKVNGQDVTSDETIDLGREQATQTLTFGEALKLDLTVKLGYALKEVQISGLTEATQDSASFVNLFEKGGAVTMNFVTVETAQVTVSSGNVSLADKAGIKVDVKKLTSNLNWKLSITDGERIYTASAGAAGILQTDHTVYGDVFALKQGFEGTVYIPFNVYRGNTYGGKQFAPFDYGAVADKPASVTGKIYLECLTGLETEEFIGIFSGWEYVTALPALSKAGTDHADLYQNGDADLLNGVAFAPKVAIPAEKAGSAASPVSYGIKITPAEPLSFNVAGVAFRVKNVSGADFGWRIYISAENGKVYVPQAANVYTLISNDGTATEHTNTNRNIIIPADFDGTVLAHFAEYATDTVTDGMNENVVRDALNVSYLRIYCGGDTGGVLVGGMGSVAYDGSYTAIQLGEDSIGELYADQSQFTIKKIASVPVTVNSEDVLLSKDSVIFGTNTILLTPKSGKLIMSLTVPQHCTYKMNADGSATVTIVHPIDSTETSYAIAPEVDDALEVNVTASAQGGSILYHDTNAANGFVVPASLSYQIKVTADEGYRAEVKAGDTLLTAGEDGVYTVPAGTSRIAVTFIRLSATLTVTVGANGAAEFGGNALVSGPIELDQGDINLLTVTPERGYDCTVMLGETELTAGENGYEISIFEDSELTVTFTLHHYKITYDLDRGTNGENPATYTVNDTVELAPATKEGYNFLGWYVNNGDEEKEIEKIEQGSVGDITVYAKFEMITQTDPSNDVLLGVLLGVGALVLLGGVALAVIIPLKRKGKKND